ncbi:MAG TPA: hypothetical protein VMS55_18850, partial [Myxococcota bacterium]|nr:hypothetical protein [Myxococcota bacterium]
RELSFDVRHERRGEGSEGNELGAASSERPHSLRGRKVVTSGRLHAGGEVFSEAEGTFVVPKPERWTPGG